ncbi:hypothetical protein BT69DRAFT_1258111 [Atractiella rhizophila]|nr:hypothetical protein BT69DRAFT_1258111 [Atractiella rhizophila]
MDMLNSITGKDENQGRNEEPRESGGMMDKLNSMAGGGRSSEKNEDMLDKGVDFVQERMGAGDQSNESAIEQAKDERISDAIRGGYKNMTGSDFPVKDKE